MALPYRIKARAKCEIERAAAWWSENRRAAPGAVRLDVEQAIEMLCAQPGLGTRVETGRSPQIRRLFLDRTGYFLYYRVNRGALEVISVWHSSRERGPSL